LYENLRTLNLIAKKVKRQIALAQIKSANKGITNVEDDLIDLHLQSNPRIHLGSLENIFFYLVLDNVKALFKLERQKKLIEKLSICQASIQPTCFSIIVINDALVKEVDVFGEKCNAFDEYMFSIFYFSPMPKDQIERLMLETL